MVINKNMLIIAGSIVGAIVLLVGVFWWVKSHQGSSTPVNPTTSEVVMEGHLTCLPKKGSGPQTMECAYGLMSEGRYYSLQTDGSEGQSLFDYTFDDVLKVSGSLSQPANDTTYDIEGTLKVKSIELVAGQS